MTASDVRDALRGLDALVRELEHADPDRVRAALPELTHRVEEVQELSGLFARALRGWVDPGTQDAIRSLDEVIAGGKPPATVPVDQAVAELRHRLADDDA